MFPFPSPETKARPALQTVVVAVLQQHWGAPLRAEVLSFPILPIIMDTQLSITWECRLKWEKTNLIWFKSIFRIIQTIGTEGKNLKAPSSGGTKAWLQLPERITFPSNFDKYHQALNVSPLCYPQMRTSIWKSSQIFSIQIEVMCTQLSQMHIMLFLISKERDSCSSN